MMISRRRQRLMQHRRKCRHRRQRHLVEQKQKRHQGRLASASTVGESSVAELRQRFEENTSDEEADHGEAENTKRKFAAKKKKKKKGGRGGK